MSIQDSIKTNNFVSMKQLAPRHPVFLVDLIQGSIVLKAEGTSHNKYVSDPIEIMNVIDPHAQSRVLSKTEIMAVRTWAAGHTNDVEELDQGTLAKYIGDALKPPLPPSPGVRTHQQAAVWLVMPAKQNLRDLGSVGEQMLDGNKTGVREMAKMFSKPGSLEKLGEVIAADAFNGNQDRISFYYPGQKWQEVPFECIQNVGNFFFGTEGGQSVVLGLDSFDPSNQFKGIDAYEGLVDELNQYPGTLLKSSNAAERRSIAQKVANDIETVLGPRNRKIAFAKKTRLPKQAAARIERGIVTGGEKILRFLKQKYAAGGVSRSLQQRLQAIGWLSRSNFPRL